MSQVIDPYRYGVTFSIKQCRNFEIDPRQTLKWLIEEGGFRRFRLMSYWNEHEKQSGKYDFSELDWQIDDITKGGAEITLCLGVRQPRWPENHWPDWAWQLEKTRRDEALLNYVEETVKHFKHQPFIKTYQLENEALLGNWGERSEVDRHRLRQEYTLVKRLDPSRKTVMTTSTSWGIPIRQPIPDIVGFSFYHTLFRDGAYHTSLFYPWIHSLRKTLIRLIHHTPVFIHELQLEPWGPKAIWEMPIAEQAKSMDPKQISTNIRLAGKVKALPVDLWGGEWWYWRLTKHQDPSIWQAVQKAINR